MRKPKEEKWITKNNDRTKAFWKVFILCCLLLLLFLSAILLNQGPHTVILTTPEKKAIVLEIPRKQSEIAPYQISVTQSGRIMLKRREQIGENLSATLPDSVKEGSLESVLRKQQADAVGEAMDNADRKWEEITENLTWSDEFAFTGHKEKDGCIYRYANKNGQLFYCSITSKETGRGLFLLALSPESIDILNAFTKIQP